MLPPSLTPSLWLIDTEMCTVGGGTGEHTFPGQLATQGCRGPAAQQLTLAKPEQTEKDLERQRGAELGEHNVETIYCSTQSE